MSKALEKFAGASISTIAKANNKMVRAGIKGKKMDYMQDRASRKLFGRMAAVTKSAKHKNNLTNELIEAGKNTKKKGLGRAKEIYAKNIKNASSAAKGNAEWAYHTVKNKIKR